MFQLISLLFLLLHLNLNNVALRAESCLLSLLLCLLLAEDDSNEH